MSWFLEVRLTCSGFSATWKTWKKPGIFQIWKKPGISFGHLENLKTWLLRVFWRRRDLWLTSQSVAEKASLQVHYFISLFRLSKHCNMHNMTWWIQYSPRVTRKNVRERRKNTPEIWSKLNLESLEKAWNFLWNICWEPCFLLMMFLLGPVPLIFLFVVINSNLSFKLHISC